jgi:hypothetical protein
MSALFGTSAPTPAPLPATPASDPAAEANRIAAENAALADSKSRGRRSTIVGGMELASEDQQVRGAAKQRQRAAATELG